MSDILFTGEFDLLKSYNTFNQFIEKIEKRLTSFNAKANAQGQNQAATQAQAKIQERVNELYDQLSVKSAEASEVVALSQGRIRQAMQEGTISIDSGNAAIIQLNRTLEQYQQRLRDVELREEEEIKSNKGHVIGLRRLEDAYLDLNTVIERTESRLNSSNEKFRESDKASQKFFKGLVIGGFAMQQLGGFLIANVTQPLESLIGTMFESFEVFDSFNARLAQTAGKSAKEIQEINDVARDVAKRPNITLQETVELFGKLEELTKGNILTSQLKSIGEGLSVALSSTRAEERPRLLAELMQVLSGGESSNLNRTLNNAVLLKKEIQEIIKAPVTPGNISKAGFTETEVLLKALENLSKQHAATFIANEIDNLKDRLFVLGGVIADIYRDRIKFVIDYLDQVVLPKLEEFGEWLKTAPGYVQNLVLTLTGLVGVLGPLAYTLGTLAVVVGGFIYLFDTLAGFLGVAAGTIATVETTTAGLAVTLGETSTLMTILSTIAAALTGTVAILSGVMIAWGAAIAYIVAISPTLQAEIINTGKILFDALKSIGSIVYSVGFALFKLIEAVLYLLSYPIAGALIALLRLLNILLATVAGGLTTLASALENLTAVLSGTRSPMTAIYEFILAVNEAKQKVLDLVPGLELLLNQFDRMVNARTNKEEIEALKKILATRKDSIESQNQDSKVKRDAISINEALAKSIEKITKLTLDETEALQKSRQAFDEQRQASLNQAANADASIRSADLSRQSSQLDLANPLQAQQALENLKTQGALKVRQAQRDFDLDVLRQENEFRQQMYEKLIELKTVDKNIHTTIQEGFQNFTKPEEILYYIQNRLPQTDEGNAVQDTLNVQYQRLGIMRSTYAQTQGKIRDLVAEQTNARRDLEKQISDADRGLVQQLDSNVINKFIDNLNTHIAQLEGDIKDVDELHISYSEKYERIRDLLNKIANDKIAILKAQKQMAAILNPNNVTAATEAQGAFDTGVTGVTNEGNTRAKQAADKYIKEIKDSQQIIDEATLAVAKVQDSKSKLNSLLVDISKNQGITLPGATKSINELTIDTLAKVVGAGDELRSAGQILASLGALGAQGKLNDLVTKSGLVKSIPPELSLNDIEGSVKRQISYFTTLINTISEMNLHDIINDNKNLNGEDLINLLKIATAGLKQLQAAQDAIEADHLNNAKQNVEIANNRRQAQVNELQVSLEMLQVQQEINATRNERNLGTSGNFIKDIFDAITDGQAKAAELEKRRLETTLQIRDLELQIAIERLQLELQIQRVQLVARNATEAQLAAYDRAGEHQIELLKKRGALDKQLIEEQIRGISKYGTGIVQILTGAISKALKGVFSKKEKDSPAVSDESTDKTSQNAQTQIGWLDKLSGKMGAVRDVAFAVGDALVNISDWSVQGILKAIKEELDALAKKALIHALEFGAIALGALVYGDFHTAAKAGKAAAAWGAVAVAAKVGSSVVGLGIKQDATTAQAASDAKANTSSDAEERKRIARLQALQITVKFDIRKENGISVKEAITAIGKNTQLTTLTNNTQSGFRFTPA